MRSTLDGRGRQKCIHCPHRSIAGLPRTQGLCPYHWNVWVYGRSWANHVRPSHPEAKAMKRPQK